MTMFSPKRRALLAQLLKEKGISIVTRAEQGAVTGPVPLTPNQCWFFEQNFAEQHRFNISMLLEVNQPLRLEPALIEQVVRHLLVHHDALRLRFVREAGEWRQFIAVPDETAPGAAPSSVPFSTIDLSVVPEVEQGPAIEAAAEQVQTSLDLFHGPLLRAVFFDLGAHQSSRLLVVAHHLVTDGASQAILMEDFMTAYQQLGRGEAIHLPAKTTSLKRWSERLVEYAQSPAMQRELEYWQFKPDEPLPNIPPPDYPEGRVYIHESPYTATDALSVEQTQILLQKVLKTYEVQIIEVMLAAMVETLASFTGDRSLYVDVLQHGRGIPLNGLDVSRTVGWFVIHYPLRLSLEGTADMVEALPLVKAQFRRPPNGGVGYDLLRYLNGNAAIKSKLCPRPRLVFSHDLPQSPASETLIRLARESDGHFASPRIEWPYLLEARTWIIGERLHWMWKSSESVYRRSTIDRLSQCFGEALQLFITPGERLA